LGLTCRPPFVLLEAGQIVDSETVISTLDCDIRALQLSATEAFVLSRIDGKTSLQDLAESLGMGFEQAAAIVARLAELKAVATEEPTSRYSTTFRGRTERARAKSDPARSLRPKPVSNRSSLSAPQPNVLRSLPPPPPEDSGRISAALAGKIEEIDGKLGALSDRALLGLDEAAGEREIKKAFARLANAFDPSNYFGVDVGEHLPALERIFARAAAAQESLLTETRSIRPRAMTKPASSPSPKKATDKPVRRSAVPASSKPPRTPPARKPSRKSQRVQVVKQETAPSPTPPSPAPLPPPATAASEPAMDAQAYARASEEAYRRDQWARQRGAEEAKARTFVQAARAAEADGDVVAAAQHYRLALQIVDDEELRRCLGRVDDDARSIVYKAARRQGADAERAERWSLAAARYSAAYEVIAEPFLAERIAYALLRDGKDLRRALKLADEAVMKEPKNAQYRITLAEVCRQAGLAARASGEAQRAREIAPTDPRVLEFVARLELDSKRR
jgi:hypothetical protein